MGTFLFFPLKAIWLIKLAAKENKLKFVFKQVPRWCIWSVILPCECAVFMCLRDSHRRSFCHWRWCIAVLRASLISASRAQSFLFHGALCQTNYLPYRIFLTAKPWTWSLWTKKTDDVSDFGADFPVSSSVIHLFRESETYWGHGDLEQCFRTFVSPFLRLLPVWAFRTH